MLLKVPTEILLIIVGFVIVLVIVAAIVYALLSGGLGNIGEAASMARDGLKRHPAADQKDSAASPTVDDKDDQEPAEPADQDELPG